MPRRGYHGHGYRNPANQVGCALMVKHRPVCCDLVFAVIYAILLTIDFLMMDTYQETIDLTYVLYLLDLGLAICSIVKAGSWIPTPCYGWWVLGATITQFFIGLASLPLRIVVYIDAIPSSFKEEDKDKEDPNGGIIAFGPIFFILGLVSYITWSTMASQAGLAEHRKNQAVTIGGAGNLSAVAVVSGGQPLGQPIIMMQPYPLSQPVAPVPVPVPAPTPAKEKSHEEVLKEQEAKIKELENQQKILALEGKLKEMEARQNVVEEAAYYPPPAYGQPAYYDPNAPPYDPNAPPYDPNYQPAPPPAGYDPAYYPPPTGEQVVAPPNHAGIS